jgi:hypothetical protein
LKAEVGIIGSRKWECGSGKKQKLRRWEDEKVRGLDITEDGKIYGRRKSEIGEEQKAEIWDFRLRIFGIATLCQL